MKRLILAALLSTGALAGAVTIQQAQPASANPHNPKTYKHKEDSCPAVNLVQHELYEIKPGGSLKYTDHRNLTWVISIPKTAKEPLILAGFQESIWTTKRTNNVDCLYRVRGTDNEYIDVAAQFTILKPDTIPWRHRGNDPTEMYCQGFPTLCLFDVNNT